MTVGSATFRLALTGESGTSRVHRGRREPQINCSPSIVDIHPVADGWAAAGRSSCRLRTQPGTSGSDGRRSTDADARALSASGRQRSTTPE